MEFHGSGQTPWIPTFAETVRHAFFVEHGCELDQEIAAMLGITPSALSQRYARASRLTSQSLRSVMAPIRSAELRTEILAAWDRAAVPDNRTTLESPASVEEVMVLGQRDRPDLALAAAMEAMPKEPSSRRRFTLFAHALWACFRLDLPGEAILLAGRLKAWGEEDGIPELVAAAHAASARAMRRTLLFAAVQSAGERGRAEAALRDREPPDELAREAARFARDLVRSERIVDALRVHELHGTEEAALRGVLSSIARSRREVSGNEAALARAWQLAARIHLALGELDEAESAIREAVVAGGTRASMRLDCDHLAGRLLAARGRTEEAERHLLRTAEECRRLRFVYLERLAQTELARLAT